MQHAVPERSRILVVIGGGAIGSAARIFIASNIAWTPGGWPVATLLVNVAGAALVAAYVARRRRAVAPWWSLDFWAIGVLGSLTTFSALSLETIQLLDSGRILAATGYAAASPALGLVAAWSAAKIASRL